MAAEDCANKGFPLSPEDEMEARSRAVHDESIAARARARKADDDERARRKELRRLSGQPTARWIPELLFSYPDGSKDESGPQPSRKSRRKYMVKHGQPYPPIGRVRREKIYKDGKRIK